MDELKELIRQEGKIIYIYLSKSVSQDPEEDDKLEICYNPITIRGLLNDLTSASVNWKMPGTGVVQGKEIVCDKKYRNTIEMAYKLKIDGNEYIGWKDNSGKTQIREEGSYIRLYIYRK